MNGELDISEKSNKLEAPEKRGLGEGGKGNKWDETNCEQPFLGLREFCQINKRSNWLEVKEKKPKTTQRKIKFVFVVCFGWQLSKEDWYIMASKNIERKQV